ncbi:hypothetical protein IWW40_000281 [Coemansia sp. RSA 1250]|nr:hypothetical protein IWW40_000281 [Coemansia sp. RSA 1250]
MDIEYFGPTRYDYDTSDDESATEPAAAPSFVVRIVPKFASSSNTLVISLVPFVPSEHAEQIGVVYSPAAPPKQLPFSGNMQTNNALARVFWAHNMVQIATCEQPAELQFGWIQAVAQKLSPRRIVVVYADAPAHAMNEYRSPAVLASAIILGLPAAAMNYAEAFGVPCRHIRVNGPPAIGMLQSDAVDSLFASQQTEQQSPEQLAELGQDVSASLYV